MIFGSPEYEEAYKQRWEARGGKELEDKQVALRAEQAQSSHFSTTNTDVSLVDAWGGRSCLNKSGVPQDRAGSSDNAKAAVTEGYVSSYEVKINMSKTDSGWMQVN